MYCQTASDVDTTSCLIIVVLSFNDGDTRTTTCQISLYSTVYIPSTSDAFGPIRTLNLPHYLGLLLALGDLSACMKIHSTSKKPAYHVIVHNSVVQCTYCVLLSQYPPQLQHSVHSIANCLQILLLGRYIQQFRQSEAVIAKCLLKLGEYRFFCHNFFNENIMKSELNSKGNRPKCLNPPTLQQKLLHVPCIPVLKLKKLVFKS